MEDVQVVAMLVRRCIAGDATAWEEIVQTYNRRIYNICYRFAGTSDDAQDLTQEVFIKMYRTLSSYRTLDAKNGFLSENDVLADVKHWVELDGSFWAESLRHLLFNLYWCIVDENAGFRFALAHLRACNRFFFLTLRDWPNLWLLQALQ